jgi:acyl carrier protein
MTDIDIRAMLCRALEAGAVSKVYEPATRKILLETGEDMDIASLDMDSLGRMEFSIAVEIETGVSLTPDDLLRYQTINQLVALFRDQ